MTLLPQERQNNSAVGVNKNIHLPSSYERLPTTELGKTARLDLCRGCQVTGSPTAINFFAYDNVLQFHSRVVLQAGVLRPYILRSESGGILFAACVVDAELVRR